MRKTTVIFAILAVLAVGCFVGSCGKKELPKTLKPATTKIDGNLGEHFELVDEEYKFPDISSEMRVKLKRISSEYEHSCTKAGIGIEVYDKDGNIIASKKAELEYITPLEWGSVFPTKEGETCKKSVYLPDWPDAYYGAETFKLTMIQNESD